MKIKKRTIGDVTILDCGGKITLGEGTLAFRGVVHDIIRDGAKKIVLNLGNVKYMDSSGIGELVKTHNAITDVGGQMRLVNLKKRIWDPLLITKLMTVFKAYDDEEGAIRSFE